MKKIVAMTVAFAMALSMSVFAVSANGGCMNTEQATLP